VDAGPFCPNQGTHTLCVDFDAPDAYGGFQKARGANGGAGGLDTEHFTSAPRAFVATTPDLATGSAASADLESYFDRPQSGYSMSFDFRFETQPSVGIPIGQVSYGMAATKARYALQVNVEAVTPMTLHLAEYAEDDTGAVIHTTQAWPTSASLDLEKWYRLIIDVDAAITTAVVSVGSVGETPTVVLASAPLKPTVTSASRPFISVGLVFLRGSSAQRAQFDNILFDWK
jgi:hypothetical protein